MKTWEMIKKLSENPNLKFVCDSYTAEVNKISGLLCLKYANRDSKLSGNIRLIDVDSSNADEWELVREPVDFMTAINSGKIVRSEYWNNGEKFDPCNREALVAITTKCFFGKWYIED